MTLNRRPIQEQIRPDVVDEAEELGVKVEVGHINDAWFKVEVWDDDDLEQVAEASTPEESSAAQSLSTADREKRR